MNIFAIEGSEDHIDWRASAQSQDNLRVNNMIRESCQMLSTALNLLSGGQVAPYKSTHINHPATRWATVSAENWISLADHCDAMIEEFKLRFRHGHACQRILDACADLYDPRLFPQLQATPLPLCMPEEFHTGSIVESYRRYYASKERIRYPLNKIPAWFTQYRTLPFVVVS